MGSEKRTIALFNKKCDILISMPKSSAYIDGIYGNKPSLLYFDEYFENLRKTGPTAHEKMGIDIKLNKTNLTDMIKEALYNKKAIFGKNKRKHSINIFLIMMIHQRMFISL